MTNAETSAREGKALRIAFLVVKNPLRGGGIEKYTYETGRRLAARGHRVTVYSMPHYGDLPPEVEGMRVVGVPCLRHAAAEKITAGLAGALRVLLTGERYDVVHFHSVAAGAFGFLPRLRGMKTVFQMHGIEWQRTRWSRAGRGVLRLLEALSLRGHTAYTAVSRLQCDFYRRRNGVEMSWIPTGADVPPPPGTGELARMGLTPGGYVLFASRLVREKGAHFLIEAFRGLETGLKLVVAGDARGEEAYKAELKALAGDDLRVAFPGFVEGRALVQLFANAAVYVQPSVIEGLSIALLEAMGHGICCLVSDIPENLEALGGTGCAFRSEDAADLGARLAELLAAPERRVELGRQARARVGEQFSWDRIADRFEALYRSLPD